MKLSSRVRIMDFSVSASINSKIRLLKKQGVDAISLSLSEPELDTLYHIKEAAKKAIDEGFIKYTAPSGISELKKAICAKLRRDNWLDYEAEDILVSNGTNHSIFNIIMSLVEAGDEVIIPIPYWPSYKQIVVAAGGKNIFLKTENFKINPKTLQKLITGRTKLLILNSPCNPSGIVYTEKELKQIAAVCIKNNIMVLSDEGYEFLTFEKKHVSIASINDKIKKLTVVINGLSITYAMGGFRVGYAAGEKELISSARRFQDHSTSNISSVSQRAALAALTGPQDHIPKMVWEYKRRRDFMVDRLNRINGVYANRPESTFYVFANISDFYGEEIKGSINFCQKLLDSTYVAVVPGEPFGADNFIRLSCTTGMVNIQRGLERMEKFCEKIRR